jgi:predicted transcriptional regulator
MLSDNERMVLRKFLYNRKNLREFHISSVQQSILLAVLDHRSDMILTQKQLADELSCAQPCISKQMNKLAKSGFLKRNKHRTTVYGAMVSFNIYKPTEGFYKIAEQWYNKLGDKDTAELQEPKQPASTEASKVTKIPKTPSKAKTKEKLDAMSNIKIKGSLWDDSEGGLDV